MERPLAMTTEQPACGLGSLLSMTCRDRAEAFARRLQSRLQTLGLGTAPDSAPDEPPAPELQPAPPPEPPNSADVSSVSTVSAVTAAPPPPRPPLRLGSSSDSDLYYDFDLEPESPASPAEEALELVVEQQPRPVVEPESGCTSSFFGTSPGSDSSDSFGPDAFVSPSSSPAWFTRRRTSPPFSYDKCNGHAVPVRHNGSTHPPKETGSANPLKVNGSENVPRDYGSTHTQVENESLHPKKEELAQSRNENASAHPVWKGDSAHTMLDDAFSQKVLRNRSEHSILMNGSAVSMVDDGSTRLHLQNLYAGEHCGSDDESPPQSEESNEQSNASVHEDNTFHLSNSLNFESESDSERLTDVTGHLETISVHEPEESDSAEHTLTEIDETESELCPDVTSTESASLYVSQDDEIDLLPSEPFSEEQTHKSRGQEDDELDGFTFSDFWEDRFSDYTPGEGLKEREQETKEEEESKIPENENLNICHTDSSYQSTFTRPTNLTLECPSEALTSENLFGEETPNVLEELDALPNRSFWEDEDEPVPQLTCTLIINREDNLKDEFEVPETTSKDGAEREVEIDESKDETAIDSSSCTSPPPQVICELSPDDEESDEEESSRDDDDDNRLKPEPRRRPKPEDVKEEEDDDEESPRRRLRRCSSLKTGKTPPGTPHRKKIVRFADVLGLDLADVRTFLDEIPRIPSSAYDDLTDADLSLGSPANPVVAFPIDPKFSTVAGPDAESAMSLSLCAPCKMLVPTFQQPGGQMDFLERIRTRFVCLENAVVNDAATSSIAGMVRVRNLDFHKSVYIRYSIDGWKTYSDLQATYVPSSCDGFSDKFSFVLFAHTLSIGQRLEFAVRFQCKGSQYWDSNGGANYGFQCLPATSSAPFMPLPSPDDRWGSFY